MRNKILALLVFISMSIFSLGPVPIAKADTTNGFIDLPKMSGVPANKQFTITFSSNIDTSKIDAIVIKQDNRFIPVDITYDTNKAYVTPIKSFGEGEYDFRIFLSNGKKYSLKFTASNTDDYTTTTSNDKVIKVYPRSTSGFSYPYYLYIPNNLDTSKDVHLLVEPNNNGAVGNSDYQDILVKKSVLTQWTISSGVSYRTNSIELMPVFPRGVNVDGTDNPNIYTHELDRDTLLKNDGEKVRIDEQLVNMIADAKKVLNSRQIASVKDKVFMVGFSASARFTNRFALLHPEMVQAVATGGINSDPIIPLNQLEGQTLTYPVGIGDVQSITGTPVNLEAYKSVKQYIFMGENDTNDDVPFSDGYDDNERNEIYTLLGKNQLPDRWNKVQQIFSTLPYPIQFVTYKGIGHETRSYTYTDMVNFFNQNSGDTFTKIQPQNAY